jgi:hypothetical protein
MTGSTDDYSKERAVFAGILGLAAPLCSAQTDPRGEDGEACGCTLTADHGSDPPSLINGVHSSYHQCSCDSTNAVWDDSLRSGRVEREHADGLKRS